MDKAQRYLGLARKAGLLATGADGCADAIASGKAKLLMLASDASPNTAKRNTAQRCSPCLTNKPDGKLPSGV